MSIIATLLGWTKAPQWALELIVVGALAGGLLWYHHHVYETGITAQQQADQHASAKALAAAATATAAAQEAANKAEEFYHAEISADNAAAAREPLPAVRLCDDPHDSSASLPEAGAAVSGAARSGATSGSVSGVPAGDPSVRAAGHPDIGHLLDVLAGRADQVSAQLREYQAR